MATRTLSRALALALAGTAVSAAGAETLDEVKKKIHDKLSGYKTLQYKMQTKTNMVTDQMTMKSTMDMTAVFMLKDGKVLSRLESKTKGISKFGEMEQKMDSTSLMINDGEFLYTLMDMMG